MVKYDGCLTSSEYIDWLVDIDGKCGSDFSLEQLPMMLSKYGVEGFWDYPLTEIDHIVDNNISVVLVRFPVLYGGYEYRWCEVENDEN